uniref:NADH-ubiquinone oxidoreductase chain 4L n=1 Tax=Hemitheconyx caudicinctus TaxID=96741 RepID=I7GUL3_9SAUR|nr:NADH dehydrogenase subunit 4L [Hemitheconyx caudicinctus]BAM34428.1 NADH dehydrogenase subunit 4L [Hemitheconyx caudicinctus]
MTPAQLALTSTFIASMLGTTFHRKYFISALLCMESMLLSLFVGLTNTMQTTQTATTTIMPMTLLTFSACETGAGLALMIASSRTTSTNLLKMLNSLKC